MRARIRSVLLLGLAMMGCGHNRSEPLVIAHRGASGLFPEHSLVAYAAAVGMQADMLEPDLVATKDGVLICSHDLTLEGKTNIADVYPDRARDGAWHAIDFTAAELARVSRKHGDEVWADTGIVTFDAFLAFVARCNAQREVPLPVIPELKAPAYHLEHGIDSPARMLADLRRHAVPATLAYIQCFEAKTLQRLKREQCPYPLLYLVGAELDRDALQAAAAFAEGIGPSRKLLEAQPEFVTRCHELGLLVFPYTFHDEPDAVRAMQRLGVDGLFSNYPDRTRAAFVVE